MQASFSIIMELIQPFKLKPIFKDKIWGGNKIKTHLKFDFSPLPNCGEMWVLSGIEGNESEVMEGPLQGNTLSELLEVFMEDLVGEKNYLQYENRFPLLIKFIDSHDWLSIQVHPDDELAEARKLESGKTEMWYVLQADKEAQLIKGFNQDMDAERYQQRLENNNLEEVLNFVEVKAGDAFYIPGKTVHALGPGVLLAEIQQSSDTTYRIYDWNRKDAQGNGRQLHLEEAMESIRFEQEKQLKIDYQWDHHQAVLSKNEFFTTQIHHYTHGTELDYSHLDSFVVLLITQGSMLVKHTHGQLDCGIGEVIFVPALTDSLELHPLPECQFLEIYL
jgi:mannose-6-phosphate isomerase